MVIKFKIENQTVRATNYNVVVADSINFVGANFSFDAEWEGYIKTVTFTNVKTHITKSILLGSEQVCTCHIPWEVLQDEEKFGGKLNVYVEGFYNGSVATTAVMNAPLIIKDSGRNGGCFPSPTPDVYQQILNRLNWLQTKTLSDEDVKSIIAEQSEIFLQNYLAKDNVDEYTPEEDYHPATKKYVDEHAPGIIDPDDPDNPMSPIVPYIDPDTKHWFVGETDTGVIAEGATGESGIDGKDGVTPHIGENGNWFVGENDTEVSARGNNGQPGEPGPQGERGLTGATGAPGEDGVTPHIGGNKNWYIGNTDTGVCAEGKSTNAGLDLLWEGIAVSKDTCNLSSPVSNYDLILVNIAFIKTTTYPHFNKNTMIIPVPDIIFNDAINRWTATSLTYDEPSKTIQARGVNFAFRDASTIIVTTTFESSDRDFQSHIYQVYGIKL